MSVRVLMCQDEKSLLVGAEGENELPNIVHVSQVAQPVASFAGPSKVRSPCPAGLPVTFQSPVSAIAAQGEACE